MRRALVHSIVGFVLAAGFGFVAHAARAQDVAGFYKGKTVRVIVGFSSGGGYDQYGRLLAQHIGRHIPGAPTILVQNMPGAASLKSTQYLDQGAPTDGTTIVTFNPGLITQSLTAPEKAPVDFRAFAWIGNIAEDIRVCFTWGARGMKSWKDFVARDQVVFGNTGVGTSAYIEDRMLHDLFGVKLKQVQGYPGSADKRLAIEKGELDGDCGSWTSMPEDWLRDKKIDLLVRFSRHLAPGLTESTPYAGEFLPDEEKRKTFELLMAGAELGRPFIASKSVPADRVAALRRAFDETMKDPDFLDDAERQKLLVTPMTGEEVAARIEEIYRTPPAVIAQAKEIAGD